MGRTYELISLWNEFIIQWEYIKNNLEEWREEFRWKDNIYIYILLMNKTIVMKRRRIGIMLNRLDDDGIMIEMITVNVMRRDIG